MKKAMVLAILLPVLLLCGVGYAVVKLNGQEDQVVITENVLYGKPEETYGLTAQISATLYDYFFWDTTHQFGQIPQTKTATRFCSVRTAQIIPPEYYIELGDGLSGGMSSYGRWAEMEQVQLGELSGLERAYWELAQKTQAGEEESANIRLKDYYDYYPVEVEIHLKDCYYTQGDFRWALYPKAHVNYADGEREEMLRKIYREFEQFFRIPVLDTEEKEIHLEKDENGNICSWGYSGIAESGDRYDLYTTRVTAEDACYLAIGNRSYEGMIIDTSHIPGGYGLYAVPYTPGDGEQETVVHSDRLAMVYPLDEREAVRWMQVTQDQQRLVVLTQDEESFTLRVIRREDMVTLQELRYPAEEEAVEIFHIFWEEDHMLLRLSDERLVLFSIQRDGTYRLEFSVEEDPTGELELPLWSGCAVTDWNGEKLAVLMEDDIRYGDEDATYCGAKLAVYDGSGLLYCGEYTNSLDTQPGYQGFSRECCMLLDYEPLKIRWN